MSDRWPPFIPAVLDDYPLDAYEFRVFCRVARRQSRSGRGCDESNRRTADETGMSESKVRYAKALLVRAGLLIVTEHPGQTNEYRLAPPSDWAPPERLPELRQEIRDRRYPKGAETRQQQTDHQEPQETPDPTPDARSEEPRSQEPRSDEPDTAVSGTAPPRSQEPTKVLPQGSPRKVRPPADWQQAWSQVHAEAARVGSGPGYSDRRRRFDDRTEATIRALGGWKQLCALDQQRGHWEFRDAWNRVQEAAA